MVTTNYKPKTERQHAVATLHSLLRDKELARINEIMDPGEKSRLMASIDAELLRAQSNLDASPEDPPETELEPIRTRKE